MNMHKAVNWEKLYTAGSRQSGRGTVICNAEQFVYHWGSVVARSVDWRGYDFSSRTLAGVTILGSVVLEGA